MPEHGGIKGLFIQRYSDGYGQISLGEGFVEKVNTFVKGTAVGDDIGRIS